MEDGISIIQQWFQDCESNHGNQCMPSVKEMPKRLIEVGEAGRAPKLILGVEASNQSRRYTTLSHCWGDELPIRTLKSNIQQFSYQIPPQLIPCTFRDAIAITQALAIQYLWIDALCIVQDSSEEWEQEAVRMKDVYSGSCLNIAASDVFGSEGGCFHRSSTAYVFVVNRTNNSELLVRLHPGDTRQMTRKTVLSSRAWVLQEQLLSHRMISCMASELHWECSEIYKSNSGAQFEVFTTNIRGVPSLYQNAANSQPDAIWRSWMQDFSERKITFCKDRLPALSGVIQYYQSITGDVPLLGLWKNSLLQDVLWVRLGQISAKALCDTQNTNLPSWSWLSCPTRIAFDIWQITITTTRRDQYVSDQDHCLLIDCAVEWIGPSFASAVESAYIVLEGPTAETFIDVDKEAQQSDPPYLRLMDYSRCSPCTGQFDCGNVRPGRYTCLLIRSRVHSQTNARRDIFLILEIISTSTEYHRVGIGCVFGHTFFGERTVNRLLIK